MVDDSSDHCHRHRCCLRLSIRLPDVYESTTLIVVRPSTLPTSVVPTVAEDNMTRQLTSISQVVTSRSSLEPLVEKYDLYKTERLRGEPMESVIDMMRRDIKVDVNTSRNDITNGFNISFRYRDPKVTQAITSELASKYISAQTTRHQSTSGIAAQSVHRQPGEPGARGAGGGRQATARVQVEHVGNLPSEAQALFNQLVGFA